jgi:hypothetical protein
MSDDGLSYRIAQRLEDNPLYQLVKLKLGRMLHGANPDSEDFDSGIGVALSVLTLPGAFLSLILFNKYGSLLHFLRGQLKFDPYAASLPDEYLFIVLAMLVSGGVALWKWDTLFLDRRDLVNIVPLPVHPRQIFQASLLAVALLALIFCVDVNAVSAVLYPLVVSASQESFLFWSGIALGHVTAILAASLFSFAAVFAIAGIFMAGLSARAFQAVSLYLRGAIAVALLLLFSGAFSVTAYIGQGTVAQHAALRYLPSIWFLGVCQWARGDAGATFRHFAFLGLIGLVTTAVVGALAYALAYQRHFSRMAELVPSPSGHSLAGLNSLVGRVLDRTILRTPFERSGFRFVVRTLGRSDRHRAAVAVFAAIGLVAGTEYLLWSGVDPPGPSTAQFVSPLILLYCCILGLRYTFDLPVELNANWVFRFLIAPTLEEGSTLAAKTIVLLMLPIIVVVSVVFGMGWGFVVGACEALVLAVLSVTLATGIVLSFRKLPFTCAKAAFQQNALPKLLICVPGIFVFAMLPANLQHWARSNPMRLLVFVPFLAVVWWGIYEVRSRQVSFERQITFQETDETAIALLNLSA